MPAITRPQPIRLAIVNDYPIVSAGIETMLAPYGERVQVVSLDAGAFVGGSVDVVLYDTFARPAGDHADLIGVLRESPVKVVVFTWNLNNGLIAQAFAEGAVGCLSKSLPAAEVVSAIEEVYAGTLVTRPTSTPRENDGYEVEPTTDGWIGKPEGLTRRESEILVFITQGLSNQEIAETAYLSINSVKSFIRTLYRKIGVTRRAQAVRYGIENGFRPSRASGGKRHPVARVEPRKR